MAQEQQRKFLYTATFSINGTTLAFDSPDSITLPETKQQVLTRFNNKLNRQIKLPGRVEYTDLSIRGTLQVVDGGGSPSAQMISTLQNLPNQLNDRVDVTINVKTPDDTITYTIQCLDCFVSSFKLDEINRQNGDDAMMSATIVLSPASVRPVQGPQMP